MEEACLQTYEEIKARLGHILPDMELRYKAKLVEEIILWKNRKDALIIAHEYMEPTLFHSVADHRGDSLAIARKAAASGKNTVVCCGVHFMAELVHVLSPEITVLLPSRKAGCSLADSIAPRNVRELKSRFPGVPVVCYITTYAGVQAEADICCTAANAVTVVESLDSDTVIFLPDEHLARNVAQETGKHIVFPDRLPRDSSDELDRQMVGWNGRCEVHERFSPEDIERVRRQFPDVMVVAHPECSLDVVQAADFSGTMDAIRNYVRETHANRYLFLTEYNVRNNLIAENPDKEILDTCRVRCRHMNQITVEDTLAALRYHRYSIEVLPKIRERARQSIDRMIAAVGDLPLS